MVDPVCGMTVRADGPHRLDHRGTTYAFCCAGCLEKFRNNPARYLKPDVPQERATEHAPNASASAAIVHAHTCPMHPEVKRAGPGSCPSCGMGLEPIAPGITRVTRWTCPMHSEINREEPGACPKCGMALEPTAVAAEEDVSPELRDMSRRFWGSLALTIPLVIMAMSLSSVSVITNALRLRRVSL